MTSTPVIRLNEPRDLLAVVPYRLGFHPAESAVVMATHRTARGANELGLTARMDLADLAHPTHGRAAAERLAHHFLSQRPADVIAVLYTDAGLRDADCRLARVTRHLSAALERALDPWVVTPDGWGHLAPCPCCPPGGHPPAALTASAAGAGMVLEGLGAVPRRADLAVARVAAGPRTEAAGRGVWAERASHREVRRASGGSPLVRGAAFGVPGAIPARDQRPLQRWRENGADLWDEAVRSLGDDGTAVPDGATLGRLLAFLEDKVVRDAVVAATMAGVQGATAPFLDPNLVGATYDTPFPPCADVVDRVLALAASIAAHSAPGEGAPALGLLAFVAWWGNEGARADVIAHQALAEDPGHRLAALVVEALDGGLPPAWVTGEDATPGR